MDQDGEELRVRGAGGVLRCAAGGLPGAELRSATAQVTDEVMHKMAERLRPPSFKEGFDKITVVRVKGQPAGAAIAPAPAVPAADGDAFGGGPEQAAAMDEPMASPEAAV